MYFKFVASTFLSLLRLVLLSYSVSLIFCHFYGFDTFSLTKGEKLVKPIGCSGHSLGKGFIVLVGGAKFHVKPDKRVHFIAGYRLDA